MINDELSPNPASPSKSTKKSRKSNKHNNNNKDEDPTASSAPSLTRDSFTAATSSSQQRKIIRLEGEMTIEDLERENHALLKSQDQLFAHNTRQQKSIDHLVNEQENLKKRDVEQQFHIAALQMELQTLAERLGSTTTNGNQNQDQEQTPASVSGNNNNKEE